MLKRAVSLFFTLAILFSFGLAGCAKSSEPPAPTGKQNDTTSQQKVVPEPPPAKEANVLKPGDFFPVTLGSSWEYQGEGNEYASFKRTVLFSRGEVAQMREDNGGTVSASVYKITPGAVTRVFFRGEAYDKTNYLNAKSNENLIVLEAPLKAGTKWNGQGGTREIVDINAVVKTPAGEFTQCVKVKIGNGSSTEYEYFKRGVGLVKREFISGESRITSSLKMFISP